jgi:ABC-type branched-subunit amino acid transport system ATPase component
MGSDGAVPLLQAIDLSRHYGSGPILNRVSIGLRSGTVTLLTGRNGSGKTTLVNCLAGFDRSYSGEVFLGERRVDPVGPSERARLGIVRTFQYPHLFDDFSVRDHLTLSLLASSPAFRSYFRQRWRSAQAERRTTVAGVADLYTKRGAELSFGEMKLVNTARAIATGARILLLDEPLASLHGEKRVAMVDTIRSLRDAGCAMLVIEHVWSDLLPMADAAYELENGNLQELPCE